MRRWCLPLVALFAIVPAHASTVTATKSYTQATGDALVLRCDVSDAVGGIGGACFELAGTETSVGLEIADVTTLPVGGMYQLTTSAGLDLGDVLSEGSFCGGIDDVPIPPEAVSLVVYVDGPAFGPLDCAPASPGIGLHGTITATFTTRA